MKKNDILAKAIAIAIIVAIFAVAIAISKMYFDYVTGSNLPDWLKYMLLRR